MGLLPHLNLLELYLKLLATISCLLYVYFSQYVYWIEILFRVILKSFIMILYLKYVSALHRCFFQSFQFSLMNWWYASFLKYTCISMHHVHMNHCSLIYSVSYICTFYIFGIYALSAVWPSGCSEKGCQHCRKAYLTAPISHCTGLLSTIFRFYEEIFWRIRGS